MTQIELIYDSDCPNVDTARANLKQALVNLSFDTDWTEWERTQASAPAYVQRYGSPTVLIDGNPIGKTGVNEEGNSCSIYLDEHGKIAYIPSVNQMRSAIQKAILKRKARPIMGIISSSGSGISALIPVISCPLCWPAYTSLLAALGIGFFNYSSYLIPLLISFIGFVGFSLWRDYHFHKRIIPFLFALFGGASVIFAKIIYSYNLLLYTGIACLVVASIINIFYVKKMAKKLMQPCEGCCQKMEEKNE